MIANHPVFRFKACFFPSLYPGFKFEAQFFSDLFFAACQQIFPSGRFLPDMNAFFRFKPHAVPFMNVKDIIEVLKILRLNVCAQNVRSMHVDCKKQFLALKRRLHAPDASPVEEESFDIRLFFALGCFECTAQSAGISDVFGNDELAVALDRKSVV